MHVAFLIKLNINFNCLKPLLPFSFIILLTCTVHAQKTWYINAGVGPMNYFGDLKETPITVSQMQFNGTAGITWQRTPRLAASLALTYGKLKASDSENGPKWFYRNLSFESSLFEAAAILQYDFIDIEQSDENNIAEVNPAKITPYVFGGIGLFHFNPYTYDLSGKKVYLQPLGTEGQTTPYSLWQVSFPVGIGVKYALSNTIMLSGEIDFRKTLADYIDDVSQHQYVDTVQLLATHGQEAASLSYRADEIPGSPYKFYGYRGNPKKKDGYYSFMLKVSYQIFTHRPKFYYGY
jgi:hypothetical protein